MGDQDRLIGNSTSNSMKLAPGQLGAPGTHGAITVVPVFRGEEANERRLTDTEEREFTCSVQLLREVSSRPDVNGAFTAEDGGSFLSVRAGTVALEISTVHGAFSIKSNALGELSVITMTLRARAIGEAIALFQVATTPLIDHLSYVGNVPIKTGILKAHDRKNDVQRVQYISPFQQVTVNNHLAEVRPELQAVYALYREARNSESPYYQLLCHFKIMEGVNKLKGRIIKQARRKGVQLRAVDDVVPHHPDLADDLRQHVGKSVKQFQDAVLTKRYRDAVAHFEKADASVLQVSSLADFVRFAEAAFAAELCVRTVVANYEDLARSADTS